MFFREFDKIIQRFHEKSEPSNICVKFFKRGASEAAEGCLASVAAKLVKTAKEIPFYIHLRENKSGRRIWAFFCPFSYAKQNLQFSNILARGNKSGRRIWAFLCPFSYAKQNLQFSNILARGNKSGRRIWAFLCPFLYAKQNL